MATDKSYPLKLSHKEIRIEADGCVYCGAMTMEYDHFIPKCVIKIFPVDNWLLPSCRDCNQIAGSFLFRTFLHKSLYVCHSTTVWETRCRNTTRFREIIIPNALLTRLKKVNQLQRPVKNIIRMPTFRRSGTWDTSQRVEYYIDCSDSYLGISNFNPGKEPSA